MKPSSFLAALAFVLVLIAPARAFSQMPLQYSTTGTLQDTESKFLRHRFGITLSNTGGDKIAGNLMLSVQYAYRFSSVFEVEANIGSMNNPFLHNIVGIDAFDLIDFDKRVRAASSFDFFQSSTVLGEIGVTLSPFPYPWDCVHFTAGVAAHHWAGYVFTKANLLQ